MGSRWRCCQRHGGGMTWSIRLPGREFLASTPFADPMGKETNPRKPNIDVEQIGAPTFDGGDFIG